jgi:thiamine biosynthesis lipoprotein
MGSDAHVIVVGGDDNLLDLAVSVIEDLERRWSRFLDDSEISELNRRAGNFVAVSEETIVLIQRAMEAWRLTGGAFEPTVLGAMVRAGYDRSFELLGPTPAAGNSLLGIGVADIQIEGDCVRLPAGTGFDPGGIGKGLAADMVCAEMLAAGADGVCINLGGDVRVCGMGPGEKGWTVAVEHPWSVEPLVLLGVADGAIATSTTLRRRWQTGGETRHHLIDPQTGLPSDTDLTLATVVAAEGWMAEVLAKAVLLAGSAHPFDIIGGTGAQALAVDRDGHITASAGLRQYHRPGGLPAGATPPGRRPSAPPALPSRTTNPNPERPAAGAGCSPRPARYGSVAGPSRRSCGASS